MGSQAARGKPPYAKRLSSEEQGAAVSAVISLTQGKRGRDDSRTNLPATGEWLITGNA